MSRPVRVAALQTLEIVTKMVREGAITAEAAKRHAHVLKSVKVLWVACLSTKNMPPRRRKPLVPSHAWPEHAPTSVQR